MPRLIAKSPLAGSWPVTHGGVSLSEVVLEGITSVAVLPGGQKAVDKALKPLGVAFPAPGRFTEKAELRLVWTGRDQAFLLNGALACEGAALTDQSDGWACLRLEGAAAADVLARLYPLDLRAAAFPPGHAARAALGHMSSVLMRVEGGFEILVFRSMARSAWTELEHAMQHVAARAGA